LTINPWVICCSCNRSPEGDGITLSGAPRIDATDRLIDGLVYELYGLSAEWDEGPGAEDCSRLLIVIE
jgi:hypothetical protein